MVKTIMRVLALALVLGLIVPPKARAWGERGHDIVTRVAVRLLAAKIAKGTPLALQFGRKEFMLGHLSNVPDIVWRNQGEAIEKINAPTHFLDLEYVSPELTFATIPRTPSAALARMKKLCANPPQRLRVRRERRFEPGREQCRNRAVARRSTAPADR